MIIILVLSPKNGYKKTAAKKEEMILCRTCG